IGPLQIGPAQHRAKAALNRLATLIGGDINWPWIVRAAAHLRIGSRAREIADRSREERPGALDVLPDRLDAVRGRQLNRRRRLNNLPRRSSVPAIEQRLDKEAPKQRREQPKRRPRRSANMRTTV